MAQERKAMLGHKVRRLRTDLSMTQTEMAEHLEISASYLNLIEHNQRALTVPLLLRLGQKFDVDLQAFAEDDESRLSAQMNEVLSDPMFQRLDVGRQDMKQVITSAPAMAQALITLYQGYRETREDLEALAERVADSDRKQLLEGVSFAVEEVRDFFHAHNNHFPDLEAAANQLWDEHAIQPGELDRALVDYLNGALSVRVKRMPVDVMGDMLRRYDRHSRRILLSEILDGPGRTFQLAAQIALLNHRALLDRLVEAGDFRDEDSQRLARMGLANYFAGAVLMPYERFHAACRETRYDIETLQARFDASFEQICHRLTTLQRPGAKGVAFFMIRVDKAGNVSKRFSATGFHFARFGGACPRWVVYDAFRAPGTIHTQVAAMPDGTAYFSLARTVTKPGGGFQRPPQHFAIGLGCSLPDAEKLVYADGIDRRNPATPTPIGVNCRLCERLDCGQRAFPPLNHRLNLDENIRGYSAFRFTTDRSQ